MRRLVYVYPGDPPDVALVLTGAEFAKLNPDRSIKVTDMDGNVLEETPVPEVICDSCNAEVGPEDQCVWTEHRLYCKACADQWIFPYVKEGP